MVPGPRILGSATDRWGPHIYKKPSFHGGASRKLGGLQTLQFLWNVAHLHQPLNPTWDVAGLRGPQILQGTWRCARPGMMRPTCGVRV